MASQGAGNNRGQAAGGGRFVTFSHGAAQRIAKAVRVVEGGDRNQPEITFEHPLPPAKWFRVCTFTGSWNINSQATVTFATVGTAAGTGEFSVATVTAGDTAVAMNHLYTIGDACRTQVAYIAKVAGAWHLVNVEHHETAVVTTVSLTTATLEFGRKRIWAPYPGQTASLTISLTTATSCS